MTWWLWLIVAVAIVLVVLVLVPLVLFAPEVKRYQRIRNM